MVNKFVVKGRKSPKNPKNWSLGKLPDYSQDVEIISNAQIINLNKFEGIKGRSLSIC